MWPPCWRRRIGRPQGSPLQHRGTTLHHRGKHCPWRTTLPAVGAALVAAPEARRLDGRCEGTSAWNSRSVPYTRSRRISLRGMIRWVQPMDRCRVCSSVLEEQWKSLAPFNVGVRDEGAAGPWRCALVNNSPRPLHLTASPQIEVIHPVCVAVAKAGRNHLASGIPGPCLRVEERQTSIRLYQVPTPKPLPAYSGQGPMAALSMHASGSAARQIV